MMSVSMESDGLDDRHDRDEDGEEDSEEGNSGDGRGVKVEGKEEREVLRKRKKRRVEVSARKRSSLARPPQKKASH